MHMSIHAAKILENVARVRERIAQAAERVGRNPDEIELVAVSKYVDVQATADLLAAGCPVLAESRPQQLWDKATDDKLAGARWHLVGHLQRNKVRRTLPLVELIHSVDSLRLATAINDAAKERGQIARILLEVNCSGDAEKYGLTAEGARTLLPQLANLSQVQVCGLMTMAARAGDDRVAAANFAELRELRDALRNECPPNVVLNELSMGMSHDFEIAIAEGATLVRIGSILFDGVPR